MTLPLVIQTFERTQLARLTDATLHSARHQVEAVVDQLNREGLVGGTLPYQHENGDVEPVPVRMEQMLIISNTITAILNIRYGCDD